MKRKIMSLIKTLISNIRRPEMLILPGQLSFFFLLTIIPLVTLFVSILTSLNIGSNILNDTIIYSLPDAMQGIINMIITNKTASSNIIIFFVSTLFLASNGTDSIIRTSNQMYNVETSSYIKRKIKAMIMLVVLIVLLIFILLVPVMGDMLINLLNYISFNKISKLIMFIYNLAKFPISFILIFFSVKILYVMAPDKKIKFSQVNDGAFFTTISWLIVTSGYSFYIENFSNYATIYGSISNLLVLMWWVYIISYIFVLGIGLNVTEYQIKNK